MLSKKLVHSFHHQAFYDKDTYTREDLPSDSLAGSIQHYYVAWVIQHEERACTLSLWCIVVTCALMDNKVHEITTSARRGWLNCGRLWDGA
jgi:hypothetical protein